MIKQLALLGASVLVIAGCADSGVTDESPTSTTPTTPTTVAAVTTITTTPPTTSTSLPGPSESNEKLVEEFVTFATDPGDETFAVLRLADSVALGLGTDIVRSVPAADLRLPEAWALDHEDLGLEAFRAQTGPFSPGQLLARLQSGYEVQVGEHPHCVSPPMPAPPGFEEHERVSAQPSAESINSCLMWFTVDFFVNPDGLVEAITMDVWEP